VKAVGVSATPAARPSRTSHACGHRVGPPVGVQPLDVEPQRGRARPQVRIVDAALVVVDRVVERPERVLRRGRFGRQRGGDRARVLRLQREVAERRAHRRRLQPQARDGAVRAREVRVDDDERAVLRTAHVIVGTQRGRRCAVQVAHAYTG
jgi:hypothetical protein